MGTDRLKLSAFVLMVFVWDDLWGNFFCDIYNEGLFVLVLHWLLLAEKQSHLNYYFGTEGFVGVTFETMFGINFFVLVKLGLNKTHLSRKVYCTVCGENMTSYVIWGSLSDFLHMVEVLGFSL